MDVAEWIDALMEDRDLSSYQLAKELGYAANAGLEGIRSGKGVGAALLVRVAHHFGIRPADEVLQPVMERLNKQKSSVRLRHDVAKLDTVSVWMPDGAKAPQQPSTARGRSLAIQAGKPGPKADDLLTASAVTNTRAVESLRAEIRTVYRDMSPKTDIPEATSRFGRFKNLMLRRREAEIHEQARVATLAELYEELSGALSALTQAKLVAIEAELSAAQDHLVSLAGDVQKVLSKTDALNSELATLHYKMENSFGYLAAPHPLAEEEGE